MVGGVAWSAGEGVQPARLRYSYYTAGSGGAGPTILETSFLLAGELQTVAPCHATPYRVQLLGQSLAWGI